MDALCESPVKHRHREVQFCVWSYDHWVRDDQEWGRIVRYIENNPVGAGLTARPEDYAWSSAASAMAIRRQHCRRGAQDCALHVHPGAGSEM